MRLWLAFSAAERIVLVHVLIAESVTKALGVSRCWSLDHRRYDTSQVQLDYRPDRVGRSAQECRWNRDHQGVAERRCFSPEQMGVVGIFIGRSLLRNREAPMNADDLAKKFKEKIAAAATEKGRQEGIAANSAEVRTADIEHCKNAMEREVIPFLTELQHHLGDEQFSFAPQVELHDHRPVGVSFTIGNGGPTSISTAFGNIVVTRIGDSGTSKGVPFVFAPDADPFISNSGDLTRDKMAPLVEMVIDHS
jgi:hypothetical protein